MTTTRLLFVFITLLFLSCDINHQTEKKIDDALQGIETEMDKNKSDFLRLYQNALIKTSDTTVKRQLTSLETEIASLSRLLDSMRREMNSLDLMDINNVEQVRITFLYKGVGDTLFTKLKSSSTLALNIAQRLDKKTAIKSIQDSLSLNQNPLDWKNNKFESLNSISASMVLYDLQNQLLEIGKLSVSDY